MHTEQYHFSPYSHTSLSAGQLKNSKTPSLSNKCGSRLAHGWHRINNETMYFPKHFIHAKHPVRPNDQLFIFPCACVCGKCEYGTNLYVIKYLYIIPFGTIAITLHVERKKEKPIQIKKKV